MTDHAEKDSGFLFAFIAIVAVMIVAYYFVLPNFIGYSEPHYCSAQKDASNILASLSCYFSEPENLSCASIESLVNDPTCGFYLNNGIENAKLEQIGASNDAWWIVTVTDNNSRCERGRYYRAYMGTNLADGWHE